MSSDHRHTALIVDFGGVLTTDIWPAFAAFCEIEGLNEDRIKELFRGDPEALALLRKLETGNVDDAVFEARFGAMLGIEEPEGLIARMFSGLQPEERMVEAVHRVRTAGIKTGLITNSWGTGIYERAPMDLFDAVVISGDVGLHKPQPEIYQLACERLGVEPADAVFVDDLRENCEGAEALGMRAILHRSVEGTLAGLEELFGIDLSG